MSVEVAIREIIEIPSYETTFPLSRLLVQLSDGSERLLDISFADERRLAKLIMRIGPGYEAFVIWRYLERRLRLGKYARSGKDDDDETNISGHDA